MPPREKLLNVDRNAFCTNGAEQLAICMQERKPSPWMANKNQLKMTLDLKVPPNTMKPPGE